MSRRNRMPVEQGPLTQDLVDFEKMLSVVVPEEGRATVVGLFCKLKKRIEAQAKRLHEIELEHAKRLRADTVWSLFTRNVSQREIATLTGMHAAAVNVLIRKLIKERAGVDATPTQYQNAPRSHQRHYGTEISAIRVASLGEGASSLDDDTGRLTERPLGEFAVLSPDDVDAELATLSPEERKARDAEVEAELAKVWGPDWQDRFFKQGR